MNEPQFGNKIRQVLNEGLRRDMERSTIAERLRAARERALERQRPEPATGLAWADNVVGGLGGWSGVSLRLIAPVIVLAVALGSVYSWQQKQRIAEVEEIDAMLLTDDLPIDAYLDRGFQNWVKKRAAEQ